MKPTITYSAPDQSIADLLSKALECHPVFASLLAARGIRTTDDARCFLNPDLNQLTDPFEMADMDKSVKRILTAVKNKEKILIFGDFDADGVTATALLYDFFDYCDANVSWYIPHRIKEGYSLAEEHITMAVQQDIDLIITVDCGVTSHAAVAMAAKEDIDVIVTDHHEPENDLPDALAVIDPKRKDCPSNLAILAGVGVAFFLVMALRKYFRENHFWETRGEPNLLDYLDLFVIGTIGDMVPLINENRSLCLAGFNRLRQGKRLGLKSLAQIARVEISRMDSDDITFKIVPRINAAGRLSHARICVSQLTDTDIVNTEKTAVLLDQLNSKRQKIELEIVQDIENRLFKTPSLLNNKLLYLWDDFWEPSVLGIAASKLCRKYHVPVILLSCRNTSEAIGSGRSVNHINIHRALQENASLLKRFGGHAMASGLTVKKENIKTLGQNLARHIESTYCAEDFQKTITVDAVLDLRDVTFDLANEIDRLRPFGMENPEPVFMCKNIDVVSSYIFAGSHRKMILKNAASPSGHCVEAFQFNIIDPDNQPIFFSHVLFKLKVNKFKTGSAQIIIEDTDF